MLPSPVLGATVLHAAAHATRHCVQGLMAATHAQGVTLDHEDDASSEADSQVSGLEKVEALWHSPMSLAQRHWPHRKG